MPFADAARALIVACLCVGTTFLFHEELSDEPGNVAMGAIVLIVVACVPIAFRRRVPVLPAVVALAISLVGVALGETMSGLIIAALILVGVTTSRASVRLTPTLGLFSAAVLCAIALIQADGAYGLAAFAGFAIGLLPAVLGENLRAERARTRVARELARQVEELRDRDVERAVIEERLRIARDVHDITGHHLSAIALQAAGASRLTDDPVASGTLQRIHGLTHAALSQTRGALGVLRGDAQTAPSPRLADVEDLLAPARAAGTRVDLDVRGPVRELSASIELCAHRVIQESMTNVMRHADATEVRVAIDYGAAALVIAVDDDGVGAHGGTGAGSGIQGMRERVALAGGELRVGPSARGWAVRAVLPLEDAA
jgi:signal transduction histidine kinase